MANINLLPWREELREERKREFLVVLGGVVIVAFGLLFLVDRYVNTEINNQNARNQYLRDQTAILDAKLTRIRELRSQKTALTERMSVIQDLQGTRPLIVRLFDELARTLPEGVYYNKIVRTGDSIQIEGLADTNNHVSALMRALDDSQWFAEPNLQQVRANAGAAEDAGNLFQLTVRVTTPGQEQE
ncbi:MAG: PilN domain-containing protein [Pseudomonadales bacterium]|nr:PilN domain-containing protein [Pseudomonadales bacterium]